MRIARASDMEEGTAFNHHGRGLVHDHGDFVLWGPAGLVRAPTLRRSRRVGRPAGSQPRDLAPRYSLPPGAGRPSLGG